MILMAQNQSDRIWSSAFHSGLRGQSTSETFMRVVRILETMTYKA